jgi:rhomboid protease GluP
MKSAPACGSGPALPSLADLWRGPARLTPVTLALVIANVAVFAVMLRFGAGLWHAPNDVQLAWGANFGPATKDGEWWRLVSAMFLHFGLVHLGMNMWALWDGGRLVERLYGHRRLAFLYLASGVAGNLLSLVVQGERAISGGASGAVFGVYGALLVCLARERSRVDPFEFRWLFGGVAAFSVATLVLGFIVPGIDNAAHIGGLAAGALLGIALARPLSAEHPLRDRPRWLAGAVLAAALAVLVIEIPAPRYRLGEELQAREAIREFLDHDRRIGARWQSIFEDGRSRGQSFDELAGRIDTDVAREYQSSFEQLSALNLDPAAPSAAALEILRNYAALRGDASHDLADALRDQDESRVRDALESMRRAPYLAREMEVPSEAASAGASAASKASGAASAAASPPAAARSPP